ncbi:MAG: DUF302 domain-containing protein [Vulcanimicrobiaceae bacterium]|jgi:uncharacterized protein (DUF302 family)
MEKQSKYGYAETVARLSKTITDAGNVIFDTIDQAKAAAGVGMSLRPTTLIVFGNPKGGTPLMDAHPLFALELPLKIVVWEDGGKTSIAYASMLDVAKRYGIEGDPRIANMDKALDTLASSIA